MEETMATKAPTHPTNLSTMVNPTTANTETSRIYSHGVFELLGTVSLDFNGEKLNENQQYLIFEICKWMALLLGFGRNRILIVQQRRRRKGKQLQCYKSA